MKYRLQNIITIFYLLILAHTSYSQFSTEQQQMIDSLNLILKHSKNNVKHAEAYLMLSQVMYGSSIDTAIYLSEKAKIISEKNLKYEISNTKNDTYKKVLANANNMLGYSYYLKGDYDVCLGYYTKSLALHEQINDNEGKYGTYNNLGLYYSSKGEDTLSLNYYLKAKKVSEKVGDPNMKILNLNNIATIYEGWGNNKKAFEYMNEGALIYEKQPDQVLEYIASGILNNLGFMYNQRGDVQKAIDLYLKSLAIDEKINNKLKIPTALSNIADLYKDQGNYKKAIAHYSKALKLNKKLGHKENIVNSLVSIANVYLLMNDIEKAFKYQFRSIRTKSKRR